MKLYLDDVTLPEYNEFREVTNPNVSKNFTLDGTMYVDFLNQRRAWEIVWHWLKPSEYQLIRDKFDQQFSDETFLWFGIPAQNINVPSFINIPNPKDMKWDNSLIADYTIRLEEQYAIS